jgi:hypothetical protein
MRHLREVVGTASCLAALLVCPGSLRLRTENSIRGLVSPHPGQCFSAAASIQCSKREAPVILCVDAPTQRAGALLLMHASSEKRAINPVYRRACRLYYLLNLVRAARTAALMYYVAARPLLRELLRTAGRGVDQIAPGRLGAVWTVPPPPGAVQSIITVLPNSSTSMPARYALVILGSRSGSIEVTTGEAAVCGPDDLGAVHQGETGAEFNPQRDAKNVR